MNFTLAIEKVLLEKYKPSLEVLERSYGERSSKANILQAVLSVSKDHLLNLVATNDTFFVAEWWKRMEKMPVEVRDRFIVDQVVHLRFFFFLKMVAMVETQLRIITRKLYPPDTGTREFYNIYTNLLTSLNLLNKYQKGFNIARMIRNTIHNMGVNTKSTVTVDFNGKNYEFKEGKPILFLSDKLNLDIQDMLINSIVDITDTTEFRSCNF